VKSLHWYTDDLLSTLRSWPEDVRKGIGHQLRDVQCGACPAGAKWWKGAGDGVLQLKEKGYRTIVAVAIGELVWVVHVFEKDSASGRRKTRKQHKELVRQRVAELERQYAQTQRKH
jgi:phage-related protein